jgi:DNA-directed RNA polymerase sigma subunit (sigma70/sigma32)
LYPGTRRPTQNPHTLSLDTPIGEDGENQLGYLTEDAHAVAPPDATERALLRGDVAERWVL